MIAPPTLHPWYPDTNRHRTRVVAMFRFIKIISRMHFGSLPYESAGECPLTSSEVSVTSSEISVAVSGIPAGRSRPATGACSRKSPRMA